MLGMETSHVMNKNLSHQFVSRYVLENVTKFGGICEMILKL